jgi:D-glycero-D-manno-heptose 1,7-bisphosphate phosphatase
MAAIWKSPAGLDTNESQSVLFLDRDGVLIREMDYLKDPDLVEVLDGVSTALIQARKAGYRLVGLSNQSGLGRGFFSEDEFARVMERLDEQLAAEGAPLDGFYYCPHGPDDGCSCRKPAPGMLDEATKSMSWDPATSWVIGDKASDIDLALGRGLSAFLVLTGHGAQQEALVQQRHGHNPRVHIAADLAAAVAEILHADSGEVIP